VDASASGKWAVTALGSITPGRTVAGANAYASATGAIAINAVASSSNAIGIGNNSTAAGSGSVVLGASASTTSSGSIAVGDTANAYAQYGLALGHGATSNGYGDFAAGAFASTWLDRQFAFAGGGYFVTPGDAQFGLSVLRASTTTNTPVVLTSDAAAAGTLNQLNATSGMALAFTGTLIGKQTGTANIAAYTVTGTIINNGGTLTMPTCTLTAIGSDSIVLGTAPTLTADNTNKALAVTSGAKTTTNIRWVCSLRYTEITY
jgi:hypothetical protein